jgi:hypothetical protein
MPELDAHSKLMLYLKGWKHGASCKAIIHADSDIYMAGYEVGYQAYCKAAERAQELFGAKLSVLRVQESNDATD